jgi:DNA repair photolyase
MQNETDWIGRLDEDEENGAAERYQYFMRPEPFEDLGPIKTIDDPYLGKQAKVREMSVGMVRNAADENKKKVLVYLKPFPHIRIDKSKPLQGWYKSLHEPKNVRPRPCFTEAILTEPYGGYCAVGCAFCYINSGVRGYRGTGLITVPINYGQQLRDQLSKVHRAAAGYFSSFTDPFTPLEMYYHNTQGGAEAFTELGLPIFFLSRLAYPDWAIDLLKENKHSYAQKSINTPDANDWRLLSPGAISLEEHLEEIAKLKRNGIYVSIQCNPIVAGVTSNKQVCDLFTKLRKAGADHVIVKFVEAGYSWAPQMVARMKKRFGEERGAKFEELFTENIGGQRTIHEEYRLNAHRIYAAHAKKLGLTYATCYEYRKERDETGKITNHTGISIGREFTTADQCHGHKVPVYTRKSDTQFEPLEECPPSGCLYCASENEGKPRCGDRIAGNALAVTMVQLKIPIKG